MELTVLGCHAPFPAAGGGTPGYLLEVGRKKFLIDCGSGVLSQLAKIMPIHELDGVLISHLHHDHIADFFVLQYAIMVATQLKKRETPLTVWAPTKPDKWSSLLRYASFIDLQEMVEGMKVPLTPSTAVEFYRTEHAVPCYAMKISDGKHTLLYGADSGPTTNWTAMGTEPDLFICEASYLDRDLPKEPKGHLSAKQAAIAANTLRAKRLLLTHLYPEYNPVELEQEAKQLFTKELQVAYTGWKISL